MEKIPLVKEKKICYQCFSLELSSDKFSLWCFPLAPNGFNILRYCRGHSSDFVTLHLKNFHQSHSCMHIQERRITACVNYGGS